MIKDKRLVLSIMLIILFISFFISLGNGSLKLTPSLILKAIFYEDFGVNHQIIYNVRLPRTIASAIVGSCLAAAGVILQGVMSNPLASPNITGVSSGGGLCAFIILILFPEYYYLVPAGAFIGALSTTIIIYALAWKDGVDPMRFVLSGIAISSFLNAGTNALMVFYPDRLTGAMQFMVGGLSSRTWNDIYMVLPYFLPAIVISLLFSQRLNILVLGDDMASTLGLNVQFTRFVLIIISSLLAASAVSIAGLLGFVGLIVPHMARLIIGNDYKYLLPACMLLGGSVMLLCDTLARVLFDPIEIPVGIITAILGCPFFLYLLNKRRY